MVLPPREGFSPSAVGAIGLLVHRLCTSGETIVGPPLAEPAFDDRRYVAVPPAPWTWNRARRYAAGAARALRRLRPDLVEVHNRPEVALALSRHLPRTPVTLFLHNDPQAMRAARTPRARARLLARMQVVCVSEATRARFMEGVSTHQHVPVLPNCIDLAAIPVSPTPRDPVVLFAGRVVADKGADAFVDACARALPSLPGWRAEMIGADRFSRSSPETPFLASLRLRAEAAGIALRGHMPHGRVLEAMARAAIVVVPSRWQEPFGMTALEAMASGAALIVSPRAGLLEVAGEAALRADPDQPGALSAAILRLAGDAALRAALSAQGRARAILFDAAPARARLACLRRRRLED